ncbi:hypothetical protein AA309_14440 [Microvirga vignae]|uniref:Uncharacterized protein n=1 Tax=Microvirga vignae TaxID=1225564 RepID=A0A0H1RB50_9HYPH|nr:hypothetical protein AA309_14440 [Microvirga vignae]
MVASADSAAHRCSLDRLSGLIDLSSLKRHLGVSSKDYAGEFITPGRHAGVEAIMSLLNTD